MALAVVAFVNWGGVGEFGEILRWSQTVIDMAAGDPAKGAGFGVGSPLAAAVAARGVARWWLGRPGWRQDIDDAVVMARHSDPATLGLVVSWTYGMGVLHGVLRADDSAVRAVEEAVQIAEGQQRSRTRLGRTGVGCHAAASGRRGRPSSGARAHGAGPRLAARAWSLPGTGRRVGDRPGAGQAR